MGKRRSGRRKRDRALISCVASMCTTPWTTNSRLRMIGKRAVMLEMMLMMLVMWLRMLRRERSHGCVRIGHCRRYI